MFQNTVASDDDAAADEKCLVDRTSRPTPYSIEVRKSLRQNHFNNPHILVEAFEHSEWYRLGGLSRGQEDGKNNCACRVGLIPIQGPEIAVNASIIIIS
jgi:hypothetical protein